MHVLEMSVDIDWLTFSLQVCTVVCFITAFLWLSRARDMLSLIPFVIRFTQRKDKLCEGE